MRAPALLLVVGLFASPLSRTGCARARRARAHAHVHAPRGASEPQFHLPVGRPGTIRDAPIAWFFLTEDPVPTGVAPDVTVALVPPCGTHPVYGTVDGAGRPDRAVRVRVQGPVASPDAGCADAPAFVDAVSLGLARLGTITVRDGAAGALGAASSPSVTLHVVRDDMTTPAPMLRRVRGCRPDDDASCTAGGVCATLGARTTGVCVPPLDPQLNARHPCAAGTLEVALAHAGPRPPMPSVEGAVHACLPGCDAAHPCTEPLACVDAGDGRSVCVP